MMGPSAGYLEKRTVPTTRIPNKNAKDHKKSVTEKNIALESAEGGDQLSII
jgi:hypothetical protein